ncbi:MAG: hypothetical protein QW543_04220 [Sulfolobales archaeon]
MEGEDYRLNPRVLGVVSYSVRGGELAEALRVRALPEGSDDRDALVEFLRLYRDVLQLVVNRLWSLNEVPSIKTLHRMSYSELRELGFRAHHVKQVYTYAKAVVKACKRNGGRKPVLRRLTARLDKYDYKLDLESRTLVLKIHENREVKLRLLTSTERVEKFRGWSNYEIAVKVVEDNVYVSVYFRRAVEPRRTRTVVTIDVNFDNATLAVFALSGKLLKLKRFKTPLRKILTHRIWIERIQRRYSKSWRFVRGVRRAIRRHGERIRSIAWDYVHKLGDRVAKIADEHSSTIVLEDLSNLRSKTRSYRCGSTERYSSL